MAVHFSNRMYYNNAICWNNLYKTNTTRNVSVFPIFKVKPFSVKMYSNMISNQSAGNPLNSNFGGSSETTRVTSFYNWLAGLIDGDGYFGISKNKYISCEITLKNSEYNALAKIKAQFGGSIKIRTGTNSVRWRLHNKTGIIKLVHALNGRILNPTRIAQFEKVCKLLNIKIKQNNDIKNTVLNGWFTGFFEAEGCFYINKNNFIMAISIGQKNRYLLDIIKTCFEVGNVYYDSNWKGFCWYLNSKNDLEIIMNHLKKIPFLSKIKSAELKSFARIFLYKLRDYHKPSNPKHLYFKRYLNNFWRRKVIIKKEEDIVQII